MTSERQAYIYAQLPGTLDTVQAALLKVQKLPDGTFVGLISGSDEDAALSAASTSEIRVVLNWMEELKRLMPAN